VKFGLTHRILTSALAALGVIALVSSGALSRSSTALMLVGLVVALLTTERFQQSSAARYVMLVLPSALFGVEFLRLAFGGWHLEYAVEFAAGLQILRLATRRGASHDQQVILLALLHLVAGTVLGGGITYGLCLFGFLVLAPGALVLSHLRREVEGNYRQGARDRTGLPVDVPRILRSRRVIGPGFLAMTCLLSLPILLFTALLFVAFPRVGLSLLLLSHDRNTRVVGFSDHVDLGEVGKLRDDPRIVVRVRREGMIDPPPRLPLKLRGTAFDLYLDRGQWDWSARDDARRTDGNGKSWVLTPRVGADVPLPAFADPSRQSSWRIELEPLDPTVLFLPPHTVALRWTSNGESLKPPPLERGPEGTVRYQGVSERVLRYEAFVASERETIHDDLSRDDRARYLQLPPGFPVRIRDLAKQWTAGATTDAEKAAAISDHLSRDYGYSVDAPSGGQVNPIDHFLFVSKAGHCEFFSTAMALMLRAVDVPTRNVTGYVGGTYNRFGGFYAVRQGDAHSWVEAWISGRGWVTFDPTPAAGQAPVAGGSGFWTTMRELVEALSQRWERYVVNYDLPTQMQIYQWMRRSFRPRNEPQATPTPADYRVAAKRALVVIAVLGVAGLVGWQLWKRRRRPAPTDEGAAKRTRQHRLATQVWLELEETLTAIGASRPRSVPPLTFAEQLAAERNDEIGATVLLLTGRYVQARFGNDPLDEVEARELSRQIAQLRRTAREATEGAA
jgi:transglutaminase-like putative cysteine protease